jgi:hypothetical protein
MRTHPHRDTAAVAVLVAAVAAFAAQASVPAARAEDKKAETKKIEFGTLKGDAPAGWEALEAKPPFRIAQYKIAKAEGDAADATLIVYYFGEGGGGGVDENVKRWAGQFKQPDGKDSKDVAKVDKHEHDGLKITTVDVSGTYLDKPFPQSPNVTEREKYRMLAAIVECEKGPYFLKLTGPEKTVEAAKAGWEGLLKSLK